jgi:uncharacterized membrane protein YkvA (DUF1232 family)
MATYNSNTPPSGGDVAGSAFFKKFLASAESYIQQPTRLKKLLVDSFNKAREKKEIGAIAHDVWDTLQSLFRLIKLSASGEYTGLPTTTVVAAVAVLLYFISPIDLIPDFIPVIGLLDDVALLAWFSSSIKHELDKFHEWESSKAATLVSDEELWRPDARQNPTTSTNRSAKNAGVYDLPDAFSSSTGQSATDAGLGSPSSSVNTSVHTQGADMNPSSSRRPGDVTANTTDGSRDGNDGREATGGNVR